jgi:hypothetical protein
MAEEEVKPAEETATVEATVTETVEVETEEVSPYKEELDRIEAEKRETDDRHKAELERIEAERKRQMAIKDDALAVEKAKVATVKDKWKEEVKNELREERRKETAAEEIAKLTADPAARKVIMHHYENSIVRGEDIGTNVKRAFAVANAHLVGPALERERASDAADLRSIRSMGGAAPRGGSFEGSPSAAARTSMGLAAAYAGKDKELAKKLAARSSERFR